MPYRYNRQRTAPPPPTAAMAGLVRVLPRGGRLDPVSGWGTPNAQQLIPLLARYTSHPTPA